MLPMFAQNNPLQTNPNGVTEAARRSEAMKQISRAQRCKGFRYAGDPFNYPAMFRLLRSQYPGRYERRFFAKDGTLLLIRPIKPDDAETRPLGA